MQKNPYDVIDDIQPGDKPSINSSVPVRLYLASYVTLSVVCCVLKPVLRRLEFADDAVVMLSILAQIQVVYFAFQFKAKRPRCSGFLSGAGILLSVVVIFLLLTFFG